MGLARLGVACALLVAAVVGAALIYTRLLDTDEPIRHADGGVSLASVVDLVLAEAPRAQSDYVEPAVADRARVARAFAALSQRDVDAARRVARASGYTIVDVFSGGRAGWSLTEDRSRRHGRGLFAYAPGEAIAVEVPHPINDLNTADVGMALFDSVQADSLLVAGADRRAGPGGHADVAHETTSVFHAVHKAVVSRGEVVVQIHGFGPESGRRFDAAVSSGTRATSPQVRAVTASLMRAGIQTCQFGPRTSCDELGGTTNVQGKSTRAAGAAFIHIELARSLRDTAAARARIAEAIARGLGAEAP